MTILVKNKHTLQIDEFTFKCCIGKKGSTINKKEGDKKTPKGIFEIENLYFRKDRLEKPLTQLRCIEIKKDIIEHLWKVIISDNTVDQYESNLMRRICGLIYFPDKECAEIKLKLMENK